MPWLQTRNSTSPLFTLHICATTINKELSNKDLSGIQLQGNNLDGWDFNGQTLTNAAFNDSTLAGADFTQATLASAYFCTCRSNRRGFYKCQSPGIRIQRRRRQCSYCSRGGFSNANITQAQLQSTDSYKNKNLYGILLKGNNLSGWDFSGQKP